MHKQLTYVYWIYSAWILQKVTFF